MQVADTETTMEYSAYCDVIAAGGFEQVTHLEFESLRGSLPEFFDVWFDKRRGILIEFDTFQWDRDSARMRNAGKAHYCWRCADKEYWHLRSSCRPVFSEDVVTLCGYHDCRHRILFHLSQLEEHGEFLVPWESGNRGTMLKLLNYQETYSELQNWWTPAGDRPKKFVTPAERIARVPEWVRTLLNITEESI